MENLGELIKFMVVGSTWYFSLFVAAMCIVPLPYGNKAKLRKWRIVLPVCIVLLVVSTFFIGQYIGYEKGLYIGYEELSKKD
jgi:hypothetical protein